MPARLAPLPDLWPATDPSWPKRDKLRPYEIRFHAYMARDLPAKDDDGAIDPYLCVKFAGKRFRGEKGNAGDKFRSHVVWDSMHPQWEETMTLHTWLPLANPWDANEVKLLPDVVAEVWDSDFEVK